MSRKNMRRLEIRTKLREIFTPCNKIVLVCGSEKSGKSSFVQYLKAEYVPDAHHEYQKNADDSIKCTLMNLSYKGSDFMRNQKICFCEMSDMKDVSFYKQLSNILEACGPTNESSIPVINQINACTKISAIIYVVKGNTVSRDLKKTCREIFQTIRYESLAKSEPVSQEDVESFERQLLKKLDIEKKVAYATQCNHLKWLSAHVSLKRVPMCVIINRSFDPDEININDLRMRYESESNWTTRSGANAFETSSSGRDANIGENGDGRTWKLTEYYASQSKELKLDEHRKAAQTKYCESATETLTKSLMQGDKVGTLFFFLKLGLLEELKKDRDGLIEERMKILRLRSNISNEEKLLRISREFIPLSNNTYGIQTVDRRNLENDLGDYANNGPMDDMFFVCESRWGNEKPNAYEGSSANDERMLDVIRDRERIMKFTGALASGDPLRDCNSAYTAVLYWLMRCRNLNKY